MRSFGSRGHGWVGRGVATSGIPSAFALALLASACATGSPSTGTTSSASWTHQPAAFVAWTDWSLDALTGDGWGINNGGGYATVIADRGAPLSPPSVGQWQYPPGFA